ncbi:MAG TPA: tRNA (adenosine(37)-N6)-threonylcarbamoyltransferase complex dimerization subunit type 1 TsaB [Candidatus Limnocylindria bacterium]|nr:tRNA (adenosine(37)-N6)-threonylcarbamoyltransferase complex dimerization subunit type 1 TsaB [Candidatus Limnocylindria bacterium]
MLLALDTSTDWASVAVFDGRVVLAEETWHAQRRHGEELFPTIERVLSKSGTTLASVDKVAVATGPGSFTGLRVAIASAQGIARGTDAALVGISTLDVLAYPHASTKVRTCSILPAGKHDHYAAIYQERNRVWKRRSPFMVGPLEELARQIGTHTLFVGEMDEEVEATLRALLGPRALFAAPASRVRRAGYLAELGWRELERTTQSALGEIEPIYVRQPRIGGSFQQPFAPPPQDDVALGLPKRAS